MTVEGAARLRRWRWIVAAVGIVLLPAALIAGTWDRQQPLPVRYREAGTDRNLLGTPIAVDSRGGADDPQQ